MESKFKPHFHQPASLQLCLPGVWPLPKTQDAFGTIKPDIVKETLNILLLSFGEQNQILCKRQTCSSLCCKRHQDILQPYLEQQNWIYSINDWVVLLFVEKKKFHRKVRVTGALNYMYDRDQQRQLLCTKTGSSCEVVADWLIMWSKAKSLSSPAGLWCLVLGRSSTVGLSEVCKW